MRAQFRNLRLDVPGQLRLCDEQETPAGVAVVALDSLAPAHGMGWYHTNVWLAREHHGITLADRLPFWPGQYLVCASAHSEDPRRNPCRDAALEQSVIIRYNHARKA